MEALVRMIPTNSPAQKRDSSMQKRLLLSITQNSNATITFMNSMIRGNMQQKMYFTVSALQMPPIMNEQPTYTANTTTHRIFLLCFSLKKYTEIQQATAEGQLKILTFRQQFTMKMQMLQNIISKPVPPKGLIVLNIPPTNKVQKQGKGATLSKNINPIVIATATMDYRAYFQNLNLYFFFFMFYGCFSYGLDFQMIWVEGSSFTMFSSV